MTIYYPPLVNGLQKQLDAQLDEATVDQMTLNNATNVQNKPGVVVIDRIDADGNEKSSSLREYISYTGTSGSTLTGLTRGVGGSTDQDHAVGAIVEFIPDVVWAQALINALLKVYNETNDTLLKATGAEINTGTEDAKIVTPKAIADSTIPTAASTTTFTNKRITKRITTITSNAAPTVNTDNCDCVTITAQAADITSMTTNLSGTPTDGQMIIISITDNGTARAITWGASFEASGNVSLPTTTVISTRLDVGFLYNTVTNKWRCVAVA